MTKKIVAVVGWRWEPEWLVHEWVENISPVVDDFCVIDNRNQTGPWQDEGQYRLQQRDIALKMKADWFLLTSPDERVEDRGAAIIRDAVENGPAAPRAVCLREMWTPTQVRVDGQFKYRPRFRLFRLLDMYGAVNHKRIHSPVLNLDAKAERKRHPHLDVYFYHLKNALPGNRERRVRVMKELDREIGKRRDSSWDDFLSDNVILEDVPRDRDFSPRPSREFHWQPDT